MARHFSVLTEQHRHVDIFTTQDMGKLFFLGIGVFVTTFHGGVLLKT